MESREVVYHESYILCVIVHLCPKKRTECLRGSCLASKESPYETRRVEGCPDIDREEET